MNLPKMSLLAQKTCVNGELTLKQPENLLVGFDQLLNGVGGKAAAFLVPRACLKIEGMTNFYPEGVHFKEKNARQSSDWRGFLTQKGPLLGKKTAFPIFQTSPKGLCGNVEPKAQSFHTWPFRSSRAISRRMLGRSGLCT